MKVCVLCHNPRENTGRGIDRYTNELIKGFHYEKLKLVVTQQGDLNHFWDWMIKGALFPFKTLDVKADVYFAVSQGLTLGLIGKNPLITSIHDVVPFIHPENALKDWFYRFSALIASKNSEKIITCSQASKRDIIKFLNVPASKIEVIYHGVNHNFFHPVQIKKIGKQKRQKTILFIGGYVRRHPEVLLKALAMIKKEIGDIQLLLGGTSLQMRELKEMATQLGLIDFIKLLGFVPEQHLPLYYNIADVFAFPSLYEGFGFPVLESMACGTPVVASAVGALPEIVGDSGILVKSDCEEDWADALISLLIDDNFRKSLADEALEKSNSFSWSKCVRRTMAVFKSIHD